MDTTDFVGPSGDARIDGVLSGIRWADAHVSYSDPDTAADYGAGYFTDTDHDGTSVQNEGFSQLSGAQRFAAHFALDADLFTQPPAARGFSAEAFTNLTIDYEGAGAATGTIRLANTSDARTAYAYYPDDSDYGGDAWFGPSGDNPTPGNYDWHTVIHEVGHALGLKHGHETGGGVAGAVPADFDSLEYSVMTYRTFVGDNTSGYNYESWGAPQTWMMLDVAALQHLYGADYTSNAGNTVYSWNPASGDTVIDGNTAIAPGGNRIFATLWDGGGIDTFDLTRYTTGVHIDLRAGESSTFSTAQLAYLGGGPNGGYARGNIFNALLFGGNTASLIENATGGAGADSITGNEAANRLNGGAGNDALSGGAGNDVLIGGSGDDELSAGPGANYLIGQAGNDTLDGTTGSATTLQGGAGDDVYRVDNTSDSLIEFANEGVDEVRTALPTYALRENLENLTYTGSSAFYGKGNGLDNVIRGGAGNDPMIGGAGNDVLIGGGGANYLVGAAGSDILDGTGGAGSTLQGGAGDDVYRVDNYRDSLLEFANEGTDEVETALGAFTLRDNLENLTFTGSAGFTGTGNALANVIQGGAGGDVIDGAGGSDTLRGSAGDDVLVFDPADASIDGGAGSDTLRFSGAGGNLDLTAAAGTMLIDIEIVDLTGSGGNSMTLSLEGVLAASGDADTLRVDGNGGAGADQVVASDAAGWLEGADQTIGANTYHAYTQGAALLLVDSDIAGNLPGLVLA